MTSVVRCTADCSPLTAHDLQSPSSFGSWANRRRTIGDVSAWPRRDRSEPRVQYPSQVASEPGSDDVKPKIGLNPKHDGKWLVVGREQARMPAMVSHVRCPARLSAQYQPMEPVHGGRGRHGQDSKSIQVFCDLTVSLRRFSFQFPVSHAPRLAARDGWDTSKNRDDTCEYALPKAEQARVPCCGIP